MTKAEYRSAKRSRDLIRAAFLRLMESSHDVTKITVTDIVTEAGINRSTFYAHYPDIYGVIEQIEDETTAKLLDVLSAIDSDDFMFNPAPYLRRVGEILNENRHFYGVLISSKGAWGFVEKLQETFVKRMLINDSLSETLRENPAYILRINYFAGGIVNLYRLWLNEQLDCTIDDITNEVSAIVSAAAKQLEGLGAS